MQTCDRMQTRAVSMLFVHTHSYIAWSHLCFLVCYVLIALNVLQESQGFGAE